MIVFLCCAQVPQTICFINYTAGGIVMARYAKQKTPQAVRNPFEPMLKTVEQMAVVSGIGENRLRQLMDNGELEFIQNGNRRLISEQAIWDYYNRAKTLARSVSGGC
jgi:excisionase family DNA binding protein